MGETPRIERLELGLVATQLAVTWKNTSFADGSRRKLVGLDGWIATGGSILAPLRKAEVFRQAAIAQNGALVTWDNDEGDLAIDAIHLEKITREQQPFTPAETAEWQAKLGISNSEAAGFLQVSQST